MNLTFTMDQWNFTIVARNLLFDYTNPQAIIKQPQCNVLVAMLEDDDDAFRLGDPFFASFTPVFDVENGQIGLGINSKGFDGNYIVEAADPPPDDDDAGEDPYNPDDDMPQNANGEHNLISSYIQKLLALIY